MKISCQNLPFSRDVLLTQIKDQNAVYCTYRDCIDAEIIERAGPQLKCICTASVGYDHIDVEECKKRGIRVGYTPDVATDATAELTLALLLATSRRLLEANKQVHNGGWNSWSFNWMCGQGLKGTCVGIFGFGRIGQEVAARVKPFKPKLLTYNSRTQRPKEATKIGVNFVSFDELLSQSDFIIVCCSLTPETKEIFNIKTFAKMKSNAIFINTARGGVVNQNDLYKALKDGHIRAAGLDVTTPEPLPLDNPLLKLNNVVILPHIGSSIIETRKKVSNITVENILAGLAGTEMIAEVMC